MSMSDNVHIKLFVLNHFLFCPFPTCFCESQIVRILFGFKMHACGGALGMRRFLSCVCCHHIPHLAGGSHVPVAHGLTIGFIWNYNNFNFSHWKHRLFFSFLCWISCTAWVLILYMHHFGRKTNLTNILLH